MVQKEEFAPAEVALRIETEEISRLYSFITGAGTSKYSVLFASSILLSTMKSLKKTALVILPFSKYPRQFLGCREFLILLSITPFLQFFNARRLPAKASVLYTAKPPLNGSDCVRSDMSVLFNSYMTLNCLDERRIARWLRFPLPTCIKPRILRSVTTKLIRYHSVHLRSENLLKPACKFRTPVSVHL